MEITKEFFEKVSSVLKVYYEDDKNKNFELEVKMKNIITETQFNDSLAYYSSVLNYNANDLKSIKRLDIFTNLNNRISVIDDENIRKHCADPNDTSIYNSIISKKSIPGIKPVLYDDIDVPFKIDLKKEVNIKKHEIKDSSIKSYRLKEIYSLIDDKLKYDFSIVREYNPDNFLNENVKNKYEIEIEVINDGKDRVTPKDFLRSIFELCAVLMNKDSLISKKEQMEIFTEYFNFTFPDKDITKAKINPKMFFIGPQPVTLMKKNIIPKNIDNISIQDNYTVTEKMDGERTLLYFNSIGKSYLINNRLQITKLETVNKNNIKNSLFDGEYITTKDNLKVFGIFDVYYFNGELVANKPLVPDRLNIMHNMKRGDKYGIEGMIDNIFVKEFKYKDIFGETKELLNKIKAGLFKYETDGVIYTPMYLQVGSSYKNDEVKLGGTWNRVFKWKPASENTIDFLVKTELGDTIIDNKKYKILTLYSGFNPSQWTPLTVYDYITNNIKNINKNSYIQKKFIPTGENETISQVYIEIDESKTMLASNGDIINNNSIVEFSFVDGKWKALRVRKDKTELLEFGLSGTANDYATAISIWQTIKNPITPDMVTGEVKLTKNDIEEDDIYYYRTTTRDKFININMLNFHNKYIKNMLISKFAGKNSLMDVSVGKGGDINKFINAKIKKVFGSDIKKDNIENPIDGAYARFMNNPKYKNFNYIFAPLDASKKFNEKYFDTIENKDDKKAIQTLMGLTDDKDNKYHGFVNTQFDILSCQFSIHYFFDRENSLDNFVWNIEKFLKPGGYFIGTTMDGEKVKNLLKNNNEVSWKIDDRTVWSIKKNYNDVSTPGQIIKDKMNWASADEDSSVFGKEIYVYIESIGIETKEYLFDFKTLIDKLAKYDINLLSQKELEKIKLENSYENFSTEYNRISGDNNIVLTDEEKQFSFLNMWFVFQKAKSTKSKSLHR